MKTRVLTPKQAAALLGVTLRTLERWRAQGVGPYAFKPAGRVFYTESDVHDWLLRGVARRNPTFADIGLGAPCDSHDDQAHDSATKDCDDEN